MKTLSPALLSYLSDNREIVKADLLTVTLSDTTTYRWTNFDQRLTWGGNQFAHNEVLFERSYCRVVRGVEVDEMQVKFFPDDGDQISGLPFAKAARLGVFDNASMRVDTAYIDTDNFSVVGVILTFLGQVSDVNPSKSEIAVTVKSPLERLDTMMPRNLYQTTCGLDLYGTSCGVNRAAYTSARTVLGSPAPTIYGMSMNAGAEAPGYYDGGVIVVTSGAQAGLRRTIKKHEASGVLTFILPLQTPLSPGDLFSIYPGCDKRETTCRNKFSNITRFRGFPYIPTPETIYG